MKFGRLPGIFLALTLIAAACGGGTDVAVEPVEEVEEVVEETTTTTTTTEAPVEEAPVEAEAGTVEVVGLDVYESNCSRCHASDGSGGRGPNIQGIAEEQPDRSFGVDIVTNGRRGMPSFGDDLTPEEIEAVVDYAWDTF